MSTLEIIQQNLINKKPNKEIDQQLFDKIVTHIESQDYTNASKQLKEAINSGSLDIRLIAYYLYIHFIENGIQSLEEIYTFLQMLIDKHWDQLAREEKKEHDAQISINWLLSEIGKQRKHKDPKKTPICPVLERSVAKATPSLIQNALKANQDMRKFLSQKWPELQGIQRTFFIEGWLKSYKNTLHGPVEEEPEQQQPPPTPTEIPQPEEIHQSNPMQKLTKKLQTFQKLIEQKDLTKAALCAADINNEIENFKVTEYFPHLFSTYFSLLAKQANIISKCWEKQDTIQWKFLEQLYHADIDAFANWEE